MGGGAVSERGHGASDAADAADAMNATGARATVEGEVAHVVHSDDRSTFRVIRVRMDDGRSATVVGLGPGASVGDRVRAVGRWERTKYGQQLRAEVISPADAVTDQGLARSLVGVAPGLGIGRATRIVRELGGAAATARALDSGPLTLASMTWLPGHVAADLVAAWSSRRVEREVEARLASLDLTPGLRAKLRARYGADAPRVVVEEPYRIAEEIEGVGFLTADDVARKGGLPTDSPARIDAALLYALHRDAEEGGHTCGSAADLRSTLMRVFRERPAPASFAADADASTIAAVRCCAERRVVEVDEAGLVALPALADAERAVAAGIERVSSSVADAPRIEGVEAALAAAGIPLSEEQAGAVRSVAEAGICVVTGGPGVGKSHLTRAIVVLAESAALRVGLCAPTARAARRLAEATGRDAMTIHRLLEAGQRGFVRCAENPLELDLVVVDETSMVDVSLMAAMLRALPLRCRLVLVGDADQLPPVGPGAPFRDLIASGVVPVARLLTVHRQAQGSAIVRAAHDVLAGRTPTSSQRGDRSDGCLHAVQRGSAEETADAVLEVVRTLHDELGVDPFDALVLAPMRKGACGVTALNARIQEMLNPARHGLAELAFGKDDWARLFREGDKVRQTKNDYGRGVVNGDLGRVVEVYDPRSEQRRREENMLRVRFEDGGPEGEAREVDYDNNDLRHLVLAYCGTVHSAQGGQAPAVVMALHDCHHVMLSRTILYTGITRAQRACVVVGSRRAVEAAARNARVEERRTTLPRLLAGRAATDAGRRGTARIDVDEATR